MKTIDQVSADKLRGGFYSPPALVLACLDRIRFLLGDGQNELRVLEPSAGDGAFVRGLDQGPLRNRVRSLLAVELIPAEAARCAQAAESVGFDVDVRTGSFLDSRLVDESDFDAAVGNPPFVRFQFVSESERRYADNVAQEMGLTLRGVSNLWIPIFLCALSKLREGGAFAFIIPAECLTGISAGAVRRWLLGNCADLRVDLFAPGSFPDVLQEVVIISGRRVSRRGESLLTVREFDGSERVWTHSVSYESPTWTRYLLSPAQLHAFEEASRLESAELVGSYAKFSVATVTGANDYFSLDQDAVSYYGLHPWVRPLLPRIRNAEGLTYSNLDHESNVSAGVRSYLLDFSATRDDPAGYPGPARYIKEGELQNLHERYKCRIREPWYRVPVVPPADLLLSKRSHFHPRVVVNQAQAITTDTIYQGKMRPGKAGLSGAFAASFHNSLTLLSAEIEGRSFGGGVLELVPSEVARLRVMVSDRMAGDIERLDSIARSVTDDRGEALITETDRRLAKYVPGLTDSMLSLLAESRIELQKRRLDRNGK